jgi:quercetin dioxygenase-like cupin family protein
LRGYADDGLVSEKSKGLQRGKCWPEDVLANGRLRRAAIGLAASEVKAESSGVQTSGTTRTILQRTEFPGEKYATVLVSGEIAPGAVVARHTHPGFESAFVLEGKGIFLVKGRPDLQFKAGDNWQVQPEVPYSLRNGDKMTKLAITYVVEKDKPLASPAPE